MNTEQTIELSEDLAATPETPMSRATRVLRYIGAILLLGSAVAFSVQGWSDWSSLMRHYAFLVFAFSLSALGVFCGVRLQEDKGARTFLGVAVAIIPALFAQLGAMIYAHCVSVQSGFPDFLRYSAPALSALIPSALVSIAVSGLIAYAGFRVYLGVHVTKLTKLFMLSNLMLLLPFRAEGLVALMAATQLALLVRDDFKLFSRSHESNTWEGIAARAIVLVPTIVLLGRAAFLYSFGSFCFALCLSIAGFAALYIARGYQESEEGMGARLASVALFSSAWICAADGILYSLRNMSAFGVELARDLAELEVLWYLLPVAGISFTLSCFFGSKGKGYRSFGAIVAAYAVLANIAGNPGIIASFLALALGATMVVAAFTLRERGTLYAGGLSFGLGLVEQIVRAIQIYSVSPWVSLAVSGVALVGIAVYLERNGTQVLRRFQGMRAQFAAWG